MKTIKSICTSICLILPLAVLGSQFTNGSFELPGNLPQNSRIYISPGDTRLVGWTFFGPAVFSSVIGYANGKGLDPSSPPPMDGAYHISFNAIDGPLGTYISQTFDTLAGKDYAVTFFVGRLGGGAGDVSLTATVSSSTGVQLATLKAVPPSNGYGPQQRFQFTAISTSTTLTITDTSLATKSVDVVLDAVDVSMLVPTQAPAGLVGWWPGDGNANDLAGGNTGILVNARTVPGYVGQAFAFSGQNSYVQIPNNPAINSITNALTLEAWVWHDATGANIQRYVTLTPDRALIFYNNGPVTFELHFADGANVPLRSDMSVEPRKWYHVAGTYDGKEQRLYINGVRVGVAVINRPTGWTPFNSDLDISIAGQAMNGLIDEVAFYNRALTAEEIQSHFLAGSAGMAKLLVLSPIGVFFPGNARFSIR